MSTRPRADFSRTLRTKLLLQRAKVTASGKYAAGGREKQPHNQPKPVSLPRIGALAAPDVDEAER